MALTRPPPPLPQHWVLGLRSEALLPGFPLLPLLRQVPLSVHFSPARKAPPVLPTPHKGNRSAHIPWCADGVTGDLDSSSRGERVEDVLTIILGCSRNQKYWCYPSSLSILKYRNIDMRDW